MDFGFRKAVCATFDITLGNVEANKKSILSILKKKECKDADIVVFPELCLTGYTCGDLFLPDVLLTGAKNELVRIAKATEGLGVFAVVSLPLQVLCR